MEYCYSPTPEKEEEKARIVEQFMNNFALEVDEVKNPTIKPVRRFIVQTLFETQSILGISDYDLILEARDKFSPAEAGADIVEETGELAPYLKIDNVFLEMMSKSENNIWEYTVAHVIAHESHHLRQFELCQTLALEDAEYNVEGLSDETAGNLWKRHLSEYASELFAYNYVVHKFTDRAANADFQNYVDYMKRNLEEMKRLMKEQGRSYGKKNEEFVALLEQIKEREKNRRMNFF